MHTKHKKIFNASKVFLSGVTSAAVAALVSEPKKIEVLKKKAVHYSKHITDFVHDKTRKCGSMSSFVKDNETIVFSCMQRGGTFSSSSSVRCRKDDLSFDNKYEIPTFVTVTYDTNFNNGIVHIRLDEYYKCSDEQSKTWNRRVTAGYVDEDCIHFPNDKGISGKICHQGNMFSLQRWRAFSLSPTKDDLLLVSNKVKRVTSQQRDTMLTNH